MLQNVIPSINSAYTVQPLIYRVVPNAYRWYFTS